MNEILARGFYTQASWVLQGGPVRCPYEMSLQSLLDYTPNCDSSDGLAKGFNSMTT